MKMIPTRQQKTRWKDHFNWPKVVNYFTQDVSEDFSHHIETSNKHEDKNDDDEHDNNDDDDCESGTYSEQTAQAKWEQTKTSSASEGSIIFIISNWNNGLVTVSKGSWAGTIKWLRAYWNASQSNHQEKYAIQDPYGRCSGSKIMSWE